MAQVLFDSQKGDVEFPGLTPKSIDGMAIGSATPAPGAFSTLDTPLLGSTTPPNATFAQVHLGVGTKIATASGGSATLNSMSGVVTTESLSTAAGAEYTLTLTNADVAAADQVFASVAYGGSTAGTPIVAMVTPAAGSVAILIHNINASVAVNGSLKISFAVFKN